MVGGSDTELVGRLVATARAVAEGARGSTITVLVGHSGLGKTDAVRRLRESLRAEVPGAAHWFPVDPLGTHLLEHRRWVEPRGSDLLPARPAPPPDPAGSTADSGDPGAGGGAGASGTVPWLWLGLECGPDAMGCSQGIDAARPRLARLIELHAPALLAAAVGSAPAGGAPSDVEPESPSGTSPSALTDAEVDDLFVQLARTHPTVVAADDLHLADERTAAWLRRLLADAPVSVVGTAWPQSIGRGPLGLLAEPLGGVQLEMVELEAPHPVELDLLVRQLAPELDEAGRAALTGRCHANALELAVLADTLVVRDAREMGVRVDDELLDILPGGRHDELAGMWWRLPPAVQEAVGAAAEVGAGWVSLAVGSIVSSSAEAVLAEVAGDRPAGTWVAELDECLAVWVDPVLQAVALHRDRPTLRTDDLLELHRWVVATALDTAGRWVPNDRVALDDRRRALAAEGFLPSPGAAPSPAPTPLPAPAPALPVPTDAVALPPLPAATDVTSGDLPAFGPLSTTERVRRVSQLVAELRSCDISRMERIAAEIETLLVICRREDGPMAASTMRLEIARSSVARRRSDATRALERLRPIMALALDVHGTDGRPVVEGRWNGVLLLRRVRRRADAVHEADCLVRSLERSHGTTHPETLQARGLLAETLAAAGLQPEAVALFGRLASELAQVHGPGSAQALSGCVGWADALHLAGRTAEAVALLRQADETAALTLAPEDPVRRQVRRHLAALEQGRPVRRRRNERRFGRSARPSGTAG